MNEAADLMALGFAITAVLVASMHVLTWVTLHQTLVAAEQIARALSSGKARLQSRELESKLLRYRLCKVRASFGAPAELMDAAADLVWEYRFSELKRR
jgi:hypothetical protein